MKKQTKYILLALALIILLAGGFFFASQNSREKADLTGVEQVEQEPDEITTPGGVQVEEYIPDEEGWGPIR